MQSNSLVSVIIPLYNAEKYIKETINSVLNQTYDNLELLVIDNKSTDKSLEIVQQIKDHRIQIIKLDFNSGGPARPRNIGIENAKGNYLAFLDSDDIWHNSKIAKQIKFLEEFELNMVFTYVEEIDENSISKGFINTNRVYNLLKLILKDSIIIYYTNFINTSSVLIRNNKNKFSEDKYLVALEDWAFWINCFRSNYKIKPIPEILVKYRIHNNATTSRDTDLGYRKGLFLLSFLLLNKNIPVVHYVFSGFFAVVKLIIKNIKLKRIH